MKKKTAKGRKKRNPCYVCEYCNAKAAHKVRLNHTFGHAPRLIVVANVETMVCDNCGQSYLEGAALEAVNNVLASPENYVTVLPVAVAVLA